MKQIIAVIAVIAGAGLASSVFAQQYSTETKTLTAGYAVTSTTTVSTAAMTMTKNGEVAISVSAKLTAAGTTATEFVFERSIDGTTYNAVPLFGITLTQAGTSTASVSSNVNIGAFGYVRLKSISNLDDDGILTNVVVKYTVKPNRQDGK